MNEYIHKVKELNIIKRISTGNTPKAFVLTFGCQQNEADSEHYAGMAVMMGYELVRAPEEADLIVVNTCAIREHAEKKTLSIIGQYKHLKLKKPEMIIAVGGCMVVQEHRKNELKMRYPYVDIVFDAAAIEKLPELIYIRMNGGRRQYFSTNEYTVPEDMPVCHESDYKAWVSVMYGCNNFCSYCIVPYVRGRERSRKPENIISEVRDLIQKGYKDITLLGQNVNSYGKDLGDDYDFADLMNDLSNIGTENNSDCKIRFMTSHPKDATKKLIDVMAGSDRIAHHFHLPMQSGSDRILKIMNRRYDTEKYMSTVDYLREKIPDIVITTDIIVGFPGETEEDFEMTLEMLRKVRFDMIFSFIYSPRIGTPAAVMPDQVPDKLKSERFNRLLETQNEIAEEINKKYIGKTVKVLCDGLSKNNEKYYSGRTDGNKIVFFEGNEKDTGSYINIKIERTEAFALYGKKEG